MLFNADDFGSSSGFNRGTVKAHQAGTIQSASLMVGEVGFGEAVHLAHENKDLLVGLHLAFSDARPVSSPGSIPSLVGPDGQFAKTERLLHMALLFPEGRRQVVTEIQAQFRRFMSTGLPCHHVNAHRNATVHPVLAHLVFVEARRWNITQTRVPWKGRLHLRPFDSVRFGRVLALRQLARLHGMTFHRRAIGANWTAASLLDLLGRLRDPESVELYFHPVDDTVHTFGSDLPALLDPNILSTISSLPIATARRQVRWFFPARASRCTDTS